MWTWAANTGVKGCGLDAKQIHHHQCPDVM
jgi:hypothetical protein